MVLGVQKQPRIDIPDLSGRICLVTGATSGLGEATVTELVQHNPKKTYLAARSRSRAETALARIRATSPSARSANIEILDLELSSFASIRAAADRINGEADRLDLLHLNAGVGVLQPSMSKDGYELQFAVNYVGHALLTSLLMPKLLATADIPGADVRIIVISSVLHKILAPPTGIIFDDLKTSMDENVTRLYGQSNLAKSLFAQQLAQRYPKMKTVTVVPAGAWTNIWSGPKAVNPLLWNLFVVPLVRITAVSSTEGAKNQLWASVSRDAQSRGFYMPVAKRGGGCELVHDEKLSVRLWDWTNDELKAHGCPTL